MSDEKSTTISITPTPIDPVELRRQYTESLIPPPPPKLFYPIATFILAGCVVAAVMTVIGVLATYGVHGSKSTTTNAITPELCRFQMGINGLSVYIPNSNITIPTSRGTILLQSNTTYVNGMTINITPTRTVILNLTISSAQQTYIQNQLVGCTIITASSSSSSSSAGVVPSSSSSSTGTMIVSSSTGSSSVVPTPSSSSSSSSSVPQLDSSSSSTTVISSDSSSSTGADSTSDSSSSSSSGTN